MGLPSPAEDLICKKLNEALSDGRLHIEAIKHVAHTLGLTDRRVAEHYVRGVVQKRIACQISKV